MDDDGFLVFLFSIFAGVIVFSLLMMAFSSVDADEEKHDKKQDKRYELCLEKGMQWVEGNCIAVSK